MKTNNKKIDYVTSLLTGTFSKVKTIDKDGNVKIKEEFVPLIKNEHPSLNTFVASENKTEAQIMIELGIHPPFVNINKEEFVKTPLEKKKLKDAKRDFKKLFSTQKFQNERLLLLELFAKGSIPRWGSAKLSTI